MSEAATQAALDAWSFPFWATSGLLASGLLYLRGFRRIRRTRPHLFPSWRAWCFLGGLLSLYIAVGSPIDALDDVLLSAHMTQHLIFMSVAPPLLLLGAPAVPLLRSLPRWLVRDGLGPLFRMPWLHRLFRLLTQSRLRVAGNEYRLPRLACSPSLRTGAALGCLAHAGARLFSLYRIAFLVSSHSAVAKRSRGSRWALLPYLAGADLVNTVYSASLTFSRKVIYPSYAAAPRVFDISPLADQAAAGALMWVIGSIFYLVPVAMIAVQLLSPRATFSTRRDAPYFEADPANPGVTYSPETK